MANIDEITVPSISNQDLENSLHSFLDLLTKCLGKGIKAETPKFKTEGSPSKSKKTSDQMLKIEKRLRDKDSFISSLIKDNNSLKRELQRSKDEIRDLKRADKFELKEASKMASDCFLENQILQSKLKKAHAEIRDMEEKRQGVHIRHMEQIEKLKNIHLEKQKASGEYIATLKCRLTNGQTYIDKLKGYLKTGSNETVEREASEKSKAEIYRRMKEKADRLDSCFGKGTSTLTVPDVPSSTSESSSQKEASEWQYSDGRSSVATNMSEHAIKTLIPGANINKVDFNRIRIALKGKSLNAVRNYLGESYELSLGYNYRLVEGKVVFLKAEEHHFTRDGIRRGRERNSQLLKHFYKLNYRMSYRDVKDKFDELRSLGFEDLPSITWDYWGDREHIFTQMCARYLQDLKLAS